MEAEEGGVEGEEVEGGGCAEVWAGARRRREARRRRGRGGMVGLWEGSWLDCIGFGELKGGFFFFRGMARREIGWVGEAWRGVRGLLEGWRGVLA